jgi:hypothetical protein
MIYFASLFMLNTLPHKTKQFFFVLIKISIVVAAFYFIYQKLTQNAELNFNHFLDISFKNSVFSFKNITFLVILSIFNWFIEILKWRNLVIPIKKISLKKATEQSLGALTASLFTPNRIGEYGAKAMYFTKPFRKQIVLINLISNIMQMLVTTAFGIVGLSILAHQYTWQLSSLKTLQILLICLLIIGFILFLVVKTNPSIKGVSVKKILDFVLKYPKKTVFIGLSLSLNRYLIFSFQFYFLLHVFKLEITYFEAMTFITSMYLLASVIPSIFIFDVVIKGSVAVFLFNFISVNSITILSISTIMWLLNFVLPSFIGGFYVLKFSLPKQDI